MGAVQLRMYEPLYSLMFETGSLSNKLSFLGCIFGIKANLPERKDPRGL